MPVLYQALARQTALESAEYPVLTALGATRRQLALSATARNLAVAVLGAAGAVLVAVALSPLAPVGEARLAETSAGAVFDPVALPAGALVTVAVVVLLGLWPAVRATRTLPSKDGAAAAPSAVVARLTAAGAPPSTVIGVRPAGHSPRRSGPEHQAGQAPAGSGPTGQRANGHVFEQEYCSCN